MVALAAFAALWSMTQLGFLAELERARGGEVRRALNPQQDRAPSFLHSTSGKAEGDNRIHVDGLVAKPQLLTSAWLERASRRLPVKMGSDRGLSDSMEWRGVSLELIARLAGVSEGASWVRFETGDGESVWLAFARFAELSVFVATKIDRGGPDDLVPVLPALLTLEGTEVRVRAQGIRRITYRADAPAACNQ